MPQNLSLSDREAERELRVLDEAREYLAGFLTMADTIRFVAHRVKDIVPSTGITLFTFDQDRQNLRAVAWWGDASKDECRETVQDCVRVKSVQIAKNSTEIVVPLVRNDSIVAVLRFELASDHDATRISIPLLESIAERVMPLVVSSLAFERNRGYAMIDSVTELPNERAFFQVLETKIAEMHRGAETRPLSILAIDIRDLNEINLSYGDVTGDRILTDLARSLRQHLRQMDFLARSGANEFLIVTPTASTEISDQIICRLDTILTRKVPVSDTDSVELSLDFGAASYGPDGDTPQALLRAARIRKEQSRSRVPAKVLWFPAQFAN